MSLHEEYQHNDEITDFSDPLSLPGMLAMFLGEENAEAVIQGAERNPLFSCGVIILIILLPFALQYLAAIFIGDSTDLLVEVRMGRRYFEGQAKKSKTTATSYVAKATKLHGDISEQSIGRVSDYLRIAADNQAASENFQSIAETITLVVDHIRRFGPSSVSQSFIRGLARSCRNRDTSSIHPLVSAQLPNLPAPADIPVSARKDLFYREYLSDWVETERFSRLVQGCDGPHPPSIGRPPSEGAITSAINRLRAGDLSVGKDV